MFLLHRVQVPSVRGRVKKNSACFALSEISVPSDKIPVFAPEYLGGEKNKHVQEFIL